LSIAWILVGGSVSVGAGLAAGSFALIAFGSDSFIELISAYAVAGYLRRRERSKVSSTTFKNRTNYEHTPFHSYTNNWVGCRLLFHRWSKSGVLFFGNRCRYRSSCYYARAVATEKEDRQRNKVLNTLSYYTILLYRMFDSVKISALSNAIWIYRVVTKSILDTAVFLPPFEGRRVGFTHLVTSNHC
jgi:hypothetical protein